MSFVKRFDHPSQLFRDTSSFLLRVFRSGIEICRRQSPICLVLPDPFFEWRGLRLRVHLEDDVAPSADHLSSVDAHLVVGITLVRFRRQNPRAGVVWSFELFPQVEVLVGFGKEVADVFRHLYCDGTEMGKGSICSRVWWIWNNADLRISDVVTCQALGDYSNSRVQTVAVFIYYEADSSAIARRRRTLFLYMRPDALR